MWSSHKIIGRDEELAALAALLGRLAEGAGAAVLVLGESGLGRTTLAREALIRSRDLSAVGWSNVGATARGAQGVAMSAGHRRVDPGEPSRTSRLSVREREILHLIGQGLRNNEIADCLKVSVATVERQCTNMYRKLQVRNRSQALRVVGSW